MTVLFISLAFIVASPLLVVALYARKARQLGSEVWLYPAGKTAAVLMAVAVASFGWSLRNIEAPFSATLFPFFATVALQVFLWAIGFQIDNPLSPAPVALMEETTGQVKREDAKKESETFLKKWFHPLYFALAVFLGILIGHKINTWTNFGPQDPQRPYVLHSEPWMMITAIAILVLVIVKDRYFETRTIRALDDIVNISVEHHQSLTKWIHENLTPIIISLDNRNDVLTKASSIIDTAISEKHDAERYVVFTGSAALYKDLDEQETDTDTPLAKYRSAMARLSNSSVHATRYIALLDPVDYKRRGDDTKAEYPKWIEKQITLVERNPNYLLYNCPRAPNWGSSRSSIFTAKALLDIVGNGESGILIRGEQISQDMAKSTRELFEINAVAKPVLYDKPALLSYLRKLRDMGNAD